MGRGTAPSDLTPFGASPPPLNLELALTPLLVGYWSHSQAGQKYNVSKYHQISVHFFMISFADLRYYVHLTTFIFC